MLLWFSFIYSDINNTGIVKSTTSFDKTPKNKLTPYNIIFDLTMAKKHSRINKNAMESVNQKSKIKNLAVQ